MPSKFCNAHHANAINVSGANDQAKHIPVDVVKLYSFVSVLEEVSVVAIEIINKPFA